MENTKITVDVTCQDQATAENYKALAQKMVNDKEFTEKLKTCHSMTEVYELYKESGYTDLPYEEFKEAFEKSVAECHEAIKNGEMALTEEELESIVGGFSFFKFCTSVVNVIPIAGPIIAGAAKAIKAVCDGKGASGAVLEMAKGLGTAMVDAVVTIGTAGVGTGIATGIKIGMTAVKVGLDQADIA